MATTLPRSPTERSGANVRHSRVRGAFVAVGVLALLLAGALGFVIGKAHPEAVRVRVVNVSSDGDSLCVQPGVDGDSCAEPVVSPQDRGKLKRGATVMVTKWWVHQDGGKRLVFVVDVPD